MKSLGVLLAVLLTIAAVNSTPYYGLHNARGYSRLGYPSSLGIGNLHGSRYGYVYGGTHNRFVGPYVTGSPSYGRVHRRPDAYDTRFSPYRYGRQYSPSRFARGYSTYNGGYPMPTRSYRRGYRAHDFSDSDD